MKKGSVQCQYALVLDSTKVTLHSISVQKIIQYAESESDCSVFCKKCAYRIINIQKWRNWFVEYNVHID